MALKSVETNGGGGDDNGSGYRPVGNEKAGLL